VMLGGLGLLLLSSVVGGVGCDEDEQAMRFFDFFLPPLNFLLLGLYRSKEKLFLDVFLILSFAFFLLVERVWRRSYGFAVLEERLLGCLFGTVFEE
jgi:hypothetical protein